MQAATQISSPPCSIRVSPTDTRMRRFAVQSIPTTQSVSAHMRFGRDGQGCQHRTLLRPTTTSWSPFECRDTAKQLAPPNTSSHRLAKARTSGTYARLAKARIGSDMRVRWIGRRCRGASACVAAWRSRFGSALAGAQCCSTRGPRRRLGMEAATSHPSLLDGMARSTAQVWNPQTLIAWRKLAARSQKPAPLPKSKQNRRGRYG